MILENISKIKPLCSVFGECGGCLYQDIPYDEELKIKDHLVQGLLREVLSSQENLFEPITASPQIYNYRHRLDMKMQRTRSEGIKMGFSPEGKNRLIEVNACPIAMKEVSDYLPQLKEEAITCFTDKYKFANLVVKTSHRGGVAWGGLGRKSLRQEKEDYLWVEIDGKRIFYSLETFFQANLSILPKLIERIQSFNFLNKKTTLYDLYGGVGLFGFTLVDQVKKVVLIEECPSSIKLANYNLEYHHWPNVEIVEGRVEDKLKTGMIEAGSNVAMIDPPRAGLSLSALKTLSQSRSFQYILYLSCHPESLVRDLKGFVQEEWQIEKVIPFDFFPRTKHVETLVVLKL